MEQYQIYQELGIKDEGELLRHLPRRYESLEPTPTKKDYADRERIVIRGSLKAKPQSVPGVKILRLTIVSEEGIFYKAFIFGQEFYKFSLQPGCRYIFVGRYSLRNRAVSVSQALKADNYFALTGIRPVYSLPKKIKPSDFYKLVRDVLLDESLAVKENVPEYFRKKYRLESRRQAFVDAHLPQNWEALQAGLRVFKYEEALKYALNSLCLKEYNRSFKKNITAHIDSAAVSTFLKSFSFQLTADQLRSIREIVTDMNGKVPMNRLLEGDVGTGKTAVGFTALYANYVRGAQGALMAPTLTLAQQHFENAVKTFSKFDLKIVLYDSSLTKSEKEKIKTELAAGEIDLIIGTHALFADSLKFHMLGLAVIDEQHRFGVAQRTALSQKGEGSDLLMMSATPIPRTLSKIMYADLDVSFLTEFPNNNRLVVTKVVKPTDGTVRAALNWALKEKRPIFVVVPKIDDDNNGRRKYSAKSVYEEYSSVLGSDRVGLLHGKIKSEEKESVYRRFKTGEIAVLVSTTVIEVGIDVPSAGLMIVYEANYFGLATLHQLRGRVGRDGQKAVALFLYEGDDEEALERLDFLAHTKDGYRISEFDLQNRGAGSYVGENQTGESELSVANFVADRVIFETAMKDAAYMFDHLDYPDFNVFYHSIQKDLFRAALK